jgi:hypothetical protein
MPVAKAEPYVKALGAFIAIVLSLRVRGLLDATTLVRPGDQIWTRRLRRRASASARWRPSRHRLHGFGPDPTLVRTRPIAALRQFCPLLSDEEALSSPINAPRRLASAAILTRVARLCTCAFQSN